jgi:hypothetical protein
MATVRSSLVERDDLGTTGTWAGRSLPWRTLASAGASLESHAREIHARTRLVDSLLGPTQSMLERTRIATWILFLLPLVASAVACSGEGSPGSPSGAERSSSAREETDPLLRECARGLAFEVPFRCGKGHFAAGDGIVIRGIRGDQPTLRDGGTYCVGNLHARLGRVRFVGSLDRFGRSVSRRLEGTDEGRRVSRRRPIRAVLRPRKSIADVPRLHRSFDQAPLAIRDSIR